MFDEALCHGTLSGTPEAVGVRQLWEVGCPQQDFPGEWTGVAANSYLAPATRFSEQVPGVERKR